MDRAAAICVGVLASFVLSGCGGGGSGIEYASWMGDNWEFIKGKTLLELVLPGSHNSGDYDGGLSAVRKCESDYRYAEYLRDPSTSAAAAALTQEEFDAKFIPWNVNHNEPIGEQLTRHGVRFFHLKICNFGNPGAETMDLNQVVHQHRGYTTQESLASTLTTMREFLAANPKEIIVLGFNNLHNSEPGGFGDDDVAALSQALVRVLSPDLLVTKDQLAESTVEDLVRTGRRIAIFMGGGPQAVAAMPAGIIPSLDTFAENWDDSMKSGNLSAAAAWLVEDLRSEATKRDRFYVMQANPNDNEALMYARLNAREGPHSLEEWLTRFLSSLGDLIKGAVEQEPRIRINAVSTDFLGTSRPAEIAFRLMGLPVASDGQSGSAVGGNWAKGNWVGDILS